MSRLHDVSMKCANPSLAATARVVKDHHFDLVYDGFIADDETRGFVERHNPAALQEMSRRLLEAIRRGLWRPKRNSAARHLEELGR